MPSMDRRPMPSPPEQKKKNVFLVLSETSKNVVYKVVLKKRFGVAANSRTFFLFAAFPNLYSRTPRQSLPFVQFRGSSATQKVVKTKTQLGRGSIMSAPDAGSAVSVVITYIEQ